jgi:hypothetical protein
MKDRILFVAAIDMFVNGGGAQGTHAYLDATLDIFGRDSVTVMVGDQVGIPKEYSDITFVKVPKRSSIESYVGFFTGNMSRMTKPLIEYVKTHHDEYKYCIINGSLTGGRAVKIIESYGIKTIVIFHNYEVEYHRDNKSKVSLHGHYLGSIKRAEELSYKHATLSLFMTSDDIKIFEKAYGASHTKKHILGTYDYKAREQENIKKDNKKYDIVISGSLVTYQTYIGIKDFFDKYLSITEDIIENVSIVLTGRSPSSEVLDIQKRRSDVFSIIPNPDDILTVVQEGRLYLCPTCIGGGLKLRAMDGLKCGLPVLAHEVSARGYDYYYDKDYFQIYNNEESFRIGLTKLISYLDGNKEASETINREYYEYFGYAAGVNRFKEALKQI